MATAIITIVCIVGWLGGNGAVMDDPNHGPLEMLNTLLWVVAWFAITGWFS